MARHAADDAALQTATQRPSTAVELFGGALPVMVVPSVSVETTGRPTASSNAG